jgi:hypothetical protein
LSNYAVPMYPTDVHYHSSPSPAMKTEERTAANRIANARLPSLEEEHSFLRVGCTLPYKNFQYFGDCHLCSRENRHRNSSHNVALSKVLELSLLPAFGRIADISSCNFSATVHCQGIATIHIFVELCLRCVWIFHIRGDSCTMYISIWYQEQGCLLSMTPKPTDL